MGAFSFQQGKHITSGEGGIVVSNNEELARYMRVYINKSWPYGEPNPDHRFLALNYRMTELQGAVIGAQLPKLADNVGIRTRNAARMDELLADVPGVSVPQVPEGDRHTYWKYCLTIDGNVIEGGPDAMAAILKPQGIFSAPRYVRKPAFKCEIFQAQNTFGKSRWPFTLARDEAVDYSDERFAGAWAGLRDILVLPWNEGYTDAHLDYIADKVKAAAAELRK